MNRSAAVFAPRTKFQKFVAVASTMAVAGVASAQGLAAAVTSNVDTAELLAIGAVVLGISGVILLIKSGKRSAS